jgi:hypothetical protein
MAEKYFFEYEKESKARTTARNAAKNRAVKKAESMGLKKTNLDKTAGSRPKSGDGLVQAITNQYRVTAKEAAQIVKTIKEAKPVLGAVNPAKEAAKFVGGAVKANVQLPGKVAGIAKRNAAGAVKNFKQGFK